MTKTEYDAGCSMAIAVEGWRILYTVDQRFIASDPSGARHDLRDVPRGIMTRAQALIEDLIAEDQATRKDAWVARWRNSAFGAPRQALYCNVDLSPAGGYADDMQADDQRRQTEDLDEAQVVSSQAHDLRSVITNGMGTRKVYDDDSAAQHRPILDIDFPVHVYPSTTPGHNHLYLDRCIPWEDYQKLLVVMGEIGLLEPGYVSASLARGHTAVRLPWVRKEATPTITEQEVQS